jgi:hypothetical protein
MALAIWAAEFIGSFLPSLYSERGFTAALVQCRNPLRLPALCRVQCSDVNVSCQFGDHCDLFWTYVSDRRLPAKLEPTFADRGCNLSLLYRSRYCFFPVAPHSLELEFFLRPTVSRPVRLGIGPPFGILDQSLFRSSFVGHLHCSAFNASSLTRKRVCNLLVNCFWALPEQSHLSPQNSRPYLTVSFETTPTWRARFPYLFPSGTGWPSYTPGHWVPFLSPLTS